MIAEWDFKLIVGAIADYLKIPTVDITGVQTIKWLEFQMAFKLNTH